MAEQPEIFNKKEFMKVNVEKLDFLDENFDVFIDENGKPRRISIKPEPKEKESILERDMILGGLGQVLSTKFGFDMSHCYLSTLWLRKKIRELRALKKKTPFF